MNKVLRNSFVALMAMMGLNMSAQGVTINFDDDYATLFPTLPGVSQSANVNQGIEASSDGDFTGTTTSTAVSGYTVTVAPDEDAKTPSRIWATTPRLRMYSGTFTVSGPNITKIEFTGHSTNFNLEATSGTLEGKTWTGSATNEVVFNVTKNTQINKIVINGDGGSTEPVTNQNVTVAQALEIINGLEDGAKTTEEYTVKGYVISVTEISTNYGNATFTMADAATGGDELTAFRVKGFGGANITNASLLKAGDLVEVSGLLQKYVKDGAVTPEIAQGGKIVSINGKTSDDTPNPEDAITKGKTADAPMTAAEALAYINGFTDGFTTANQYYVSGTVGEIEEVSAEYGNATFSFPNGLKAYRMKGLENKNITSDDYIKEDDEVIVLAKLQKYVKDEVVTPELSGGYIYSLNGKTKEDAEPVQFEGDGTQAKPYTVSDLKKMTEYPEETAWVKGVIVGTAKSGSALNDEDVVSNLALATDATSAEFVPVELKNNTIFRTNLNLVDTPSNKGKELKVKGQIMKYFSVTGVKNLEAYELDGQVVTGIVELETAATVSGAAYNVAGQQVNAGYKGLVIMNGKKMIQK